MSDIANIIDETLPDETDRRMDELLSTIGESSYDKLADTLVEKFGLELDEVDHHPLNIKAVIKGRQITFAKSVSWPSRTFMLLHSLGHYYFICEAKSKNIERYAYIYDLRGVQAALHYYEHEGSANGLDAPPEMTDEKRKDRVSFEVGANNFAVEMLRSLGLSAYVPIIRTYEAGDIHYIVDVSRYGKQAITSSDRDYLQKYVFAGHSVDPADAYDDGVFDASLFDVDAIDWTFLEDIKLEIHFF
ncbi:hypothetical protein [Sphingobium sp. MI1205]|uniref:hypothetical protein n=1 Tax=Sphingobium sp. MI1205 TaxID=407020 RepID=UPI000770454E|nr:hypothetical protein [Sphingobium sp. MI1205]AMK18909.1 hypothetical protein K663_12645 [Sphingobium sp. MI1205]